MEKVRIIPGNIYHVNASGVTDSLEASFADVYALTGEEEPIEEFHGPNAKPYFLALPVSTFIEYADINDVVVAKKNNDIMGIPFMVMTGMTHEIPCSSAMFPNQLPDELVDQIINTHLYAMGCEYNKDLLDRTPRGAQINEDAAEWDDKEIYHDAIENDVFNLSKTLTEIINGDDNE